MNAFGFQLRKQLAVILTVVVAWVVTVCVIPQASHACCKQATQGRIQAEMPCCVGQAAAITLDRAPSIPQPEPITPALVIAPIIHLQKAHQSIQEALLASGWRPNQSKRYLELRVLLN